MSTRTRSRSPSPSRSLTLEFKLEQDTAELKHREILLLKQALRGRLITLREAKEINDITGDEVFMGVGPFLTNCGRNLKLSSGLINNKVKIRDPETGHQYDDAVIISKLINCAVVQFKTEVDIGMPGGESNPLLRYIDSKDIVVVKKHGQFAVSKDDLLSYSCLPVGTQPTLEQQLLLVRHRLQLVKYVISWLTLTYRLDAEPWSYALDGGAPGKCYKKRTNKRCHKMKKCRSNRFKRGGSRSKRVNRRRMSKKI